MISKNVESGRVVAIESESIWVETVQQSTCQACSQKSSCGTYTLSKWSPGKRNQVRVPLGDFSDQDVQLGDYVQIKINDGVVLKSALIVYMLPLVAMMLGAVLLHQWCRSELAAVLGAFVGLGLGFVIVRWHAMVNKHNPELQPLLVGVENPTNCYIPVKVTELSE